MDEIFVSKILVASKCLWYNDDMKRKKHGFTLIEVSIFLAVTGALFAAITIGVQNSIYQQRYNDTVQGFVDFLSDLYSEVVNVQSGGDGRSEDAIYGKLVTFGDYTSRDEADTSKQIIRTYDVLAKAVNSCEVGNLTTLDLLRYDDMGTNVVRQNADGIYEPIGIVEDYTPRWAARVEKTDSYQDFVGSLLIVRNAQTGVVQTYYSPVVVPVQKSLDEYSGGVLNVFEYGEDQNYLDLFETQSIDFCINPNGNEPTNTRMNVRIIKGAHDVSGIETISFDNSDYACEVTE